MSKPTLPNSREYVPYDNGVNPDSAQLPDDNYPVIPDSTAIF